MSSGAFPVHETVTTDTSSSVFLHLFLLFKHILRFGGGIDLFPHGDLHPSAGQRLIFWLDSSVEINLLGNPGSDETTGQVGDVETK